MGNFIALALVLTTGWLCALPLLPNATMSRSNHTTTLLTDGRILTVGGSDGSGSLSSCEIYDPLSRNWSAGASLNAARQNHTATLIPDGRVVVAGGSAAGSSLTSLEVYDPANDTWSLLADFEFARSLHTATLLTTNDGYMLLFVGGEDQGAALASCESYFFDAEKMAVVGSLSQARFAHSATRANVGLYVAGGESGSSTLDSAELYDPVTGTWSTTSKLSAPRSYHTATNVTPIVILMVGGESAGAPLASTEIALVPSFATGTGPASLGTARSRHSATLLPNLQLLIAGGRDSAGSPLATTEFFTNSMFSAGPNLSTARYSHTAVLLPDSNLILGGGSSPSALNSSEIYSYCDLSVSSTSLGPLSADTGSLTQLPDGSILVSDGEDRVTIYDPITDTWSSRFDSTFNNGPLAFGAVEDFLLPDGTVAFRHQDADNLMVFDPATNSFSLRGFGALPYNPLGVIASTGQFATLNLTNTHATLFDPASTGTAAIPFVELNLVSVSREQSTVSLLPNNNLFFYGGTQLPTPTEFNPVTGEVVQHGSMQFSLDHTSTLLSDGRVLIAGGFSGGTVFDSCILFDSASGSFSSAPSMNERRYGHSATALPNGKIFISNGSTGVGSGSETQSTDIYHPNDNTITSGPNVTFGRSFHDSILLPDGRVFIFGGTPSVTGRLVETGIVSSNATRPTLAVLPNTAELGAPLTITGTGFSPVSAASGGTNSSSVNHPLVQIRHLASGRYNYLSLTSWSDTSVTTAELASEIPLGHHAISIVTNGIPSISGFINITTEANPTIANSDGLLTSFSNFAHTIAGDNPASSQFIVGSASGPLTNLTSSFSGTDAADFQIATPLPASTASGEPLPVEIVFAPSSGQTSIRDANLSLSFDATNNSPFLFGLSGQALLNGDTDGDGLDDPDEFFVHGTDPLLSDTDSDGANDSAEVNLSALGFDPLVDSAPLLSLVTANSEGLGLFEPSAFQALALSRPFISKNPDNTFTVSVELKQSDDLESDSFEVLTSVTPTNLPSGEILLSFPAPNPDASFFQITID